MSIAVEARGQEPLLARCVISGRAQNAIIFGASMLLTERKRESERKRKKKRDE